MNPYSLSQQFYHVNILGQMQIFLKVWQLAYNLFTFAVYCVRNLAVKFQQIRCHILCAFLQLFSRKNIA